MQIIELKPNEKTITYRNGEESVFIRCDATNGAFEVTLPDPGLMYSPKYITLVKSDTTAKKVTVTGKINGLVSISFVLDAKDDYLLLTCDKANYWDMGNKNNLTDGDVYLPQKFGDFTRSGANIALACAAAIAAGRGIVRLTGGTFAVTANADFLKVPLDIGYGCHIVLTSGKTITGFNPIPHEWTLIDCDFVDHPVFYRREFISVFDFLSDAQIADVLAKTYLIDCAPQIQEAMVYAWANKIELYVPGGGYLIDSYSATFDSKKYALFINNGIAGPYLYRPLRMRGAGRWVTNFTVKRDVDIDCVLGLIFNGEGYGVSDIGISAWNGSNVFACFVNGGAGPNTIERCWSGGAENGFYQKGGAVEYNDCVSEYANDLGFQLINVFNTVLDKCMSLTATTAGLKVYADTTGAQEPYQSLAGIQVSNSCFQQSISYIGVSAIFDIDPLTDTHVSVVNTVFGNNGFSTGGNGVPNSQYGIIIEQCANISFTNCQFPLNQYGNLVGNARSVIFTACTFSKTGFLLQPDSGTWEECSDLAIYTNDPVNKPTNVIVQGCLFIDSAGYAIKGNQYNSITLKGNTFINCANGGLDTTGARKNLSSATVGDSYVYLTPQRSSDVFKFEGNHVFNDSSYTAGRFGIKINCATAVPAAGNVIISGNTLEGALGTNFLYTTATAAQADLWSILIDKLAPNTSQTFPSVKFTGATYYYKMVVVSDELCIYKYDIATDTQQGEPVILMGV